MNNQPVKENPLFLVTDLYAEVSNAQKKLFENAMGEIKLSPKGVKTYSALLKEHNVWPLEPEPLDPVVELVRLLERELQKIKERSEANGEK